MRSVFLALIIAFATSACSMFDPPVPHGHAATFAVSGQMMTNTCGAQSVPVSSHLAFNAQLGYDQTQASWVLPNNNVTATGTWTDSPPSFLFAMDSYVTVRAAIRQYGIAACVIHRADTIDGTLNGLLPDLSVSALDGGMLISDGAAQLMQNDAGTTTFAATESIGFAVADGADCRDQIGVGQGQFLTLPCQITYAMNGTMTGGVATTQ